MRRKAQRVSGHGASNSTVVRESALLSANRTRNPSWTRKYVTIGEPASVLISLSPSQALRTLFAIDQGPRRRWGNFDVAKPPVSSASAEAASHRPAISKGHARTPPGMHV